MHFSEVSSHAFYPLSSVNQEELSQQFPLNTQSMAALQRADPLDRDGFGALAPDEERYGRDDSVIQPEPGMQRELQELSLIPNKQEIINHLMVWVFSTYRFSPQNESAKKYLGKCLTRMDEQGLRGSTQDLIEFYKSQIQHALERDKLSHELSTLSFEQSSLEKIEACLEAKAIREQQKDESSLKDTISELEWENYVMAAVRLEQSKRSQRSVEKSPRQPEADNKIATGKKVFKQLKQEFNSLTREIQTEEANIKEKKQKICLLEEKINQASNQVFIKEKKLSQYRVSCLKSIEDFQKEIARDIEKIKSEQKRLPIEVKILEDQFAEKVKKNLTDFTNQLNEAYEAQEIAKRNQKEDWIAKKMLENNAFQVNKNEIIDRYSRLNKENNEVFEKRSAEIFRRFNSEVIIDKTLFQTRWNSNKSRKFQADVTPAIDEAVQKRKEQVQSRIVEMNKIFEETSKKTNQQNSECFRKIGDKREKQKKEAAKKNKTFNKSVTALNEEILQKIIG